MSTVCPGYDLLRGYALGADLGPATDAVEGHLVECIDCAAALERLHGTGPLDADLRGLAGVRPLKNPFVEGLCRRLRELGPASGATTAATLDTPPPAGATPPGRLLGPPLRTGDLGRLGKYRVLRELGRGGMGVVFEAEDARLERKVALKVMRPELAADPAACGRFLREARLLAGITHPHVVTVYAADEEAGVPCLAMAFLVGQTLEGRLHGGPVPLAEALRFGHEAALGLAAVHAAGLVHRDVKPANLWLEGADARVKVLDFGLARPVEGGPQITQEGAIVGTPAYMAPEQILGHAEARSDLYALGVVMYRLVTGVLPFAGATTAEVLRQVLEGRPRPVAELAPALPPAVAGFIDKLLAREPAGRPVSAAVVARVLGTLAATHAAAPAPTIVPSTMPEAAPPAPPRRRRRAIAAVAAALLAAAVGLAFALRPTAKPPDETDPDKGGEAAVRPEGKPADRKPSDGKTSDGKPSDGKPKDKKPVEPPPPPLEDRPSSEPLSSTALVARPERLPGVVSWDLDADRGAWRPLGEVGFAPDGRLLIAEEKSGARFRYDFARGELTPLREEAKGDGSVWSPDGKMRARMGKYEVQLLDAVGEKPLQTLRGPVNDELAGVSWSPDGAILVGAQKRHHLWFWRWDQGDRQRLDLGAYFYGGDGVAFHWSGRSDSFVLQSGSRCYLVAAAGHVLAALADDEHNKAAVRWAPDNKTVALSSPLSRRRNFSAYSMPDGKLLNEGRSVELTGPAAWSPDGDLLALPVKDGVDVLSGRTFAKSHTLRPGGAVRHVAFAPDGRTLAAFTDDLRLTFWDAAAAQALGTFVLLPGGRWFAFGAEGHARGPEGFEAMVRLHYKVRPEGKPVRDLTPAEMAEEFRLRNDPARVRLLAR